VKNKGEVLIKSVDQNFPPIFHRENYILTKLPPIFQSAPLTKHSLYFLLSLYFSICTFNKTFPYFSLPPIFPFSPLAKLPSIFTSLYFSIYTLNKTFSLEGEKDQNGG